MRAFTLASEVERNPRRTDPQVLNPERVQKRWQVRIDDGQLAAIGIGLQSQQASEQEKGGFGGPCLRRTGHRIVHGLAFELALNAAEELWEAVFAKLQCCVVKSLEDYGRFTVQPIPGHAIADDGIVMRPNRAAVIAHRVEAAFSAGECADTPAAKESLVQQPLCHLPATLSATLRGQAPLSALRHLSGKAVEAAHQRSGAESGALMGLMRRAIAREEHERAKGMGEQKHMTDRFASTLVIAASIIAAVRVARDDISRPSPRLTAVVSDSIRLARTILESVVR